MSSNLYITTQQLRRLNLGTCTKWMHKKKSMHVLFNLLTFKIVYTYLYVKNNLTLIQITEQADPISYVIHAKPTIQYTAYEEES